MSQAGGHWPRSFLVSTLHYLSACLFNELGVRTIYVFYMYGDKPLLSSFKKIGKRFYRFLNTQYTEHDKDAKAP